MNSQDKNYFYYKCPVFKNNEIEGSQIVKIKKSCVPNTSFLYLIATTNVGKTNNIIKVKTICAKVMDVIKTLLEKSRLDPADINVIYEDANTDIIYYGNKENYDVFNIRISDTFFDYIGIDEYKVIIGLEDFMRDNMYTKKNSFRYTSDKYYGLTLITEESKLKINNVRDDNKHGVTRDTSLNSMLFTETTSKIQEWSKTLEKINKIRDIFSKSSLISDHVFVAGGYAYSALFGTKTGDVDLFMYGLDLTVKKSKDIVEEIITVLINTYKSESRKLTVVRTNNAITLKFSNVDGEETIINNEFNAYLEFQIILRIYQTPSEIIHGFDVDCCCMGFKLRDYDRNEYGDRRKYDTGIYVTKRALYSITNGYNTVNFDRLSPSYEYRLAKYGGRGMAVKIDNFDKRKINVNELSIQYDDVKHIEGGYENRYKYIRKLKGLDVLLSLDYRRNKSTKKYFTDNSIMKMAKETGDYDKTSDSGTYIDSLFEYLNDTKDKYPESYNKYKKYLRISMDGVSYIDTLPDGEDKTELYKILKDNELECIDNIGYTRSMITTNSFKKGQGFYYIKVDIWNMDMDNIFPNRLFKFLDNIPTVIYKILEGARYVTFPQSIEFKKTQPGEQMTNTFNKIVLENNIEWYKGKYYKYD